MAASCCPKVSIAVRRRTLAQSDPSTRRGCGNGGIFGGVAPHERIFTIGQVTLLAAGEQPPQLVQIEVLEEAHAGEGGGPGHGVSGVSGDEEPIAGRAAGRGE